jgi:folylpolyglutamate synthase/dihydropteroate synthase
MIKTYSEALTRIFKNEVIKDYSLETINKALIMLDNPLENIKIIHIAGTN